MEFGKISYCRHCLANQWCYYRHSKLECGRCRYIVLKQDGFKRSRRPVVFISGPISRGDLASNINQASEAFARLAAAGYAPHCPHWACYSGTAQVNTATGSVYSVASIDGCGLSHSDWLAIDLELVARSDALLRLPGESIGADREVAYAIELATPVFYSVEELLSALGG